MNATPLALLENQALHAQRLPGRHPANWTTPKDDALDVAIIGAGQSGIAIAAALRRAGVTRIALFDKAAPGEAGTWRRIARMRTLRTPKDLPGPDLGQPSLHVAKWYNAVHGEGAFEGLSRIPTSHWADYIDWYQRVEDIRPHHAHDLRAILPGAHGMRLHFATADGSKTVITRKLVLATGIDGLGQPHVPALLRENLPPDRYAHTHQFIDMEALKGRRVAVLGAASSAFDAAATALEAGAASVDLFARHATLNLPAPVAINQHYGASAHFHSLPDALRWRYVREARARGNVTPETVIRATRFPQFRLHLNAAWDRVVSCPDQITITAGGTTCLADFVIAGTGYEIDMTARPELATFAGQIALWQHRYLPPRGEADEGLGRCPYLGGDFAFQEREIGAAPWLRNIHAFSYGAVVSYGRHVGDIGTMMFTIPRLVNSITRDLFVADATHHVGNLIDSLDPAAQATAQREEASA